MAADPSENYGPAAKQPGISYDSLGIMRTVKRIQAIAGDTGSAVWFGHDAAQFSTICKATSRRRLLRIEAGAAGLVPDLQVDGTRPRRVCV